MTRDGAAVGVCELCKPRAEAAGWLRAEEYEATLGSAPARERRRARGSNALGGLLARFGAPPEDRGEEPVRSGAPASGYAEDPIAPDPLQATPPPVPVSGETGVPEALYAFNHSDHRRTVAGLSRTLGLPRATALEIKNGEGQPAIRLTIAWELTWYQWEVGPSGRGQEVRESGKGETIDQLRTADRAWNLLVGADGTLQEKVAPAEVSEAAEE